MSPKLKACLLVAPAMAITWAAFALRWHGRVDGYAHEPVVRQDSPAAPPATVAFCRRAAELLHDVLWAVACDAAGDDSIDCTLPDRAAADVNAAYDAEERRCLAAETQAAPVSLVPPSPRDGPTGRTARR